MEWPVWHYDGSNATRHDCTLVAGQDGFRLRGAPDPDRFYPWNVMVSVGHRNGTDLFAHRDLEGWRVIFPSGTPAELIPLLPKTKHYGGVIDRFGLWPAAAVLLALSVGLILVVLKIPEYLAPYVPMSWEKKLGDAMIGDFGGRICHGPGANKVLTDFQARLDPKGAKLDVSIVNIDMVNAVALPGGKIMLFEGLLKKADNPDEVAGVLGHEIGHVRNRDVAQALIRQFGLSAVIGGGNTGAMANALISYSYSREAEAAADDHAIGLLKAASISPDPTAAFFGKLAGQEKALGESAAALGYLSSHPLSASREKAFRDSADKTRAYKPVLSDAEWATLKAACDSDPNVKEGGLGLF